MTMPNNNPPRKTLGITGITINAITLMAPGAFAWLLYQPQVAGAAGGLGGIWLGVLAAVGTALLTALSLGELAHRYPAASLRSAYHYAEQVFRDRSTSQGLKFARIGKFLTGWAAHLYYWVYPGVMVAFIGILTDYLLRQMGYAPTPLGQVILAIAFAAFIGFLALRGITGATPSSIILNTIQLVTLTFFSILAIIFRLTNPLALSPAEWIQASPLAVVTAPSLGGLIFQTALALMLVVGFEAVTSLGAKADNPRRDIPRAVILALVLQGIFSYLFVYFASELAFSTRINLAASHAPLGDLALQLGDTLLGGNGFALMFVLAFAVMAALLGALLTAMNNGVRISFSMALDIDMPDLFGALNPRYTTPYFTVLALSTVSAIIGAAGILGGLSVLMGLILTSSMGAFLLYAILCGLTLLAFRGARDFNLLRHFFLPILGIGLNLSLAIAAPLVALSAGGMLAQAAWVALAISILWLAVTWLYYFLRR